MSQYTNFQNACDAPNGGAGGTGGSGEITNPEDIGVGLSSQIVGYTYESGENDVLSGIVYLETLYRNDLNTYARSLRYLPVNATDGTASVIYNSTTHGIITHVDSEIEFSNLVPLSLCDDLGNDQYLNYVGLFRYEQLRDGTFISTSIGTYSDFSLTSTYNPVSPIDCDTIGDDVIGSEIQFITLSGVSTYGINSLATSLEVHVITVGDNNNPPTITTNLGTHNLYASPSKYSWGVNDPSHLLRGLFTINTNVGDIVSITSTQLTTT